MRHPVRMPVPVKSGLPFLTGTHLQPRSNRSFRVATAIALVFACGGLHAQFRGIPADAKRSQIRHLQEMQIELNGKAIRLAPGVQIRDTGNRLILPIAIPPGATVRYQLDREGQPWRIWILTPEEIAARDPAQ